MAKDFAGTDWPKTAAVKTRKFMITRIVSDGDGEMMEGVESLLKAAVVTVRVCLLLHCASLVSWERECCCMIPAIYGDIRGDII